MTVKVNGTPKCLSDGSVVRVLLDDNNGGKAVAVNGAIVTRDRWNTTPLKEGDEVLIITAAYGG